jgi:phosphonate transport system ATP-binding protein
LSAAIEVIGVDKSFFPGSPVLSDIRLTIGNGEMVALIGASGSGKSTLIRSIAGLVRVDRPAQRDKAAAAGLIRILNQPMQEEGRICGTASRLRAQVGVIFQQFNLVPRLSVLTNVCLGLLGQIPSRRGNLCRFSRAEMHLAMQALERVGIAEQALKRGSDLSGGQQQRAAIARTLVQGAKVLIADEPIASLDPKAARRVMDILADLNRQDRITVLVSLHQVEYALAYCSRTIALREGRIVYDGPSSALTPVFLSELYGAESEELLLPGLAAGAPEAGHRNGNAAAVARAISQSHDVAAFTRLHT